MNALFLIFSITIICGTETPSYRLNAVQERDYFPCGTTSLYLIARLNNVDVSFADLSSTFGPIGSDGTHSFDDLIRVAKSLRMNAVALDAGVEMLKKLPMPAILQTGDATGRERVPHFLVILKSTEKGAFLLQPPNPPFFISAEGLAGLWTGKLVAFPKSEIDSQGLNQLKMRRGFEIFGTWIWCLAGFTFLSIPVYLMLSKYTAGHGFFGYWRLSAWPLLILPIFVFSIGICLQLIETLNPIVFPTAVCKIEPSTRDLGEFEPGTQTVAIPIANEGRAPLKVISVSSSCTCAGIKAPDVIEPTQAKMLEVTLNVGEGPRSAKLTIDSNDPAGAQTLYLTWYGRTSPMLVPRWVSCNSTPMNQDFVQDLIFVFPGGNSDCLPKIVSCECESPLVSIKVGDHDPSAVRLTSVGRQTILQGEQSLKLCVQAPQTPTHIRTLAKIRYATGQSENFVNLPLDINFFGNNLIPSVRSVVFSVAENGRFANEERTIDIRLHNPGLSVSVTNVPIWLAASVEKSDPQTAKLRLRVKLPPNDTFAEAKLQLTSEEDGSKIDVGVLAYSPK